MQHAPSLSRLGADPPTTRLQQAPLALTTPLAQHTPSAAVTPEAHSEPSTEHIVPTKGELHMQESSVHSPLSEQPRFRSGSAQKAQGSQACEAGGAVGHSAASRPAATRVPLENLHADVKVTARRSKPAGGTRSVVLQVCK